MRTFRYRMAMLAAVVVTSLSAGLSSPAAAAEDYNVGDRVEVSLWSNDKWYPGVVTAENDASYLVRTDPKTPGGVPGEYTVPKTASYEALIRRSSAPLPTSQQKNTSQPTGILDCPYEKGVEARKISKATVSGLIRCLYEFKGGVGTDGIGSDSRFDLNSIKIGRSRPWRVNIDVGAGDLDTRIYPVKVKWTQTWWSDTQVITKKGSSIFGCFYSTLDEWECGLNQRLNATEFTYQPRS